MKEKLSPLELSEQITKAWLEIIKGATPEGKSLYDCYKEVAPEQITAAKKGEQVGLPTPIATYLGLIGKLYGDTFQEREEKTTTPPLKS